MFSACKDLGAPLSLEKLEGPSPSVNFLRVCMNAVNFNLGPESLFADHPIEKFLRTSNQHKKENCELNRLCGFYD